MRTIRQISDELDKLYSELDIVQSTGNAVIVKPSLKLFDACSRIRFFNDSSRSCIHSCRLFRQCVKNRVKGSAALSVPDRTAWQKSIHKMLIVAFSKSHASPHTKVIFPGTKISPVEHATSSAGT